MPPVYADVNAPRPLIAIAVTVLALAVLQLVGAVSASAEQPVSFSFSSTAYSVDETAGSATITIVLNGSAPAPVSVHVESADGSANASLDYGTVSTDVSFDPGDSSKTVSVPILDDDEAEGDETVRLTLSNPSAGTALGDPSSALLTIVDNDTAFAFSFPDYYAAEGDGQAVITVRRYGLLAGTDSVHFATTTLGDLNPVLDYTPVAQDLIFAPGESSQFVLIPILNDSLLEPDEVIRIELSSPSSGVQLMSPSSAILTIYDNDKKPASPPAPAGRIYSASVTKAHLRVIEAGTVKIRYTFYPPSKRFAYVLSEYDGSTWVTLRKVAKKGSYAGRKTMTIRKLFGKKPLQSGRYRVKLTADKNSKTVGFKIT